MTILRRDKRGQSLTEYAILFSVVAAAYLGMQLYVKRGVQAHIKGVSDDFAGTESATTGSLLQYEPYYTADSSETPYEVTQTRDANVTVNKGGTIDKKGIYETTTRTKGGEKQFTITDEKDKAWTP